MSLFDRKHSMKNPCFTMCVASFGCGSPGLGVAGTLRFPGFRRFSEVLDSLGFRVYIV